MTSRRSNTLAPRRSVATSAAHTRCQRGGRIAGARDAVGRGRLPRAQRACVRPQATVHGRRGGVPLAHQRHRSGDRRRRAVGGAVRVVAATRPLRTERRAAHGASPPPPAHARTTEHALTRVRTLERTTHPGPRTRTRPRKLGRVGERMGFAAAQALALLESCAKCAADPRCVFASGWVSPAALSFDRVLPAAAFRCRCRCRVCPLNCPPPRFPLADRAVPWGPLAFPPPLHRRNGRT